MPHRPKEDFHHGLLGALMGGIHDTLHQLKPEDRLLIRDCCHRIQNFLQYLSRHEADENLLVLTAFTDDLGSE